jgi:hypothetical protein
VPRSMRGSPTGTAWLPHSRADRRLTQTPWPGTFKQWLVPRVKK